MRKGFTLIELTITILMLGILISVIGISYQYYVIKSKDKCAATEAQVLYEAVVYSYESAGNIISNSFMVNSVKDLTGSDITIVEVNNNTKMLKIQFAYDCITYVISVDLTNYRFKINETGGDRVIYEY